MTPTSDPLWPAPVSRRGALKAMGALAAGAPVHGAALAASAFQPFSPARLPGRLVVNDAARAATVVDLGTGLVQPLPGADARQRLSVTDHDLWTGAPAGRLMRYAAKPRRGGGIQVDVLEGPSLRSVRSLRLPAELSGPRLAHDGRLLLAMFTDQQRQEDAPRLSVFDLDSGRILKRGSELDPVGSPGTQFDWLPDGHYVYRKSNRLYVSHPTRAQSTLAAELPLPVHDQMDQRDIGQLSASPDGSHVAFTYLHQRGSGRDSQVWVCTLQGRGLHRLTTAADPGLPMSLAHLHPTWSPDGRWVAGVLSMSNTNVQPVYPPDDTVNPAWQVVGSSGCGYSPVFVLPATGESIGLPWPRYDPRYNLKVRPDPGKVAWLSSCASQVVWVA